MTTPLDRAAKAIKSGRFCDAGDFPCPFCFYCPDDMTKDFDETGCIWLARAALATTREPTPEMIAAGAKHIPGSDPSECAAAVWRAMHDAMMAEEKEQDK